MSKETKKQVLVKMTRDCGQAKANGRVPKDPDVPKDGYDPKSQQDELPSKKKD